jgi:hypothetical protein
VVRSAVLIRCFDSSPPSRTCRSPSRLPHSHLPNTSATLPSGHLGSASTSSSTSFSTPRIRARPSSAISTCSRDAPRHCGSRGRATSSRTLASCLLVLGTHWLRSWAGELEKSGGPPREARLWKGAWLFWARCWSRRSFYGRLAPWATSE